MKHLTVEQIIDFVSFETLDNNTLQIASQVTAHINCCDECMEKVRAFQTVYDRLKERGVEKYFEAEAEKYGSMEFNDKTEELDGFEKE